MIVCILMMFHQRAIHAPRWPQVPLWILTILFTIVVIGYAVERWHYTVDILLAVYITPGAPQHTPLMLENSRDQRGTVRYQILSTQKTFHYFMHMRAKNNMGILDLFPSEFSRMRGVSVSAVFQASHNVRLRELCLKLTE